MTDTIEPVVTQIDQRQLAQELVDKARIEGLELVGPGGVSAVSGPRLPSSSNRSSRSGYAIARSGSASAFRRTLSGVDLSA